MEFIEYIDRTLLFKKQLEKIQKSYQEWSGVQDLIQNNELLLTQFTKINEQLDNKISNYQTGKVRINKEEIIEFNDLLNSTVCKLEKIRPLLSLEKPNDNIELQGDLQPNALIKNWQNSVGCARNSMKLDEIDAAQNKLEALMETASRLVLIRKKFDDNKDLIRNYEGFFNDLQSRFTNCDELLKSDIFVDEMNSAIDLLIKISSHEKEFNRELAVLESGTFNANSLIERWQANKKVIKNSMKFKDVYDCSEVTLTLLRTGENLLKIKTSINKNEAIIGIFLGIESELENEFNECYTLGHSEELSVKLSKIIEGLERNKKLEQSYKKHSTIVSEEDKSKIEKLFELAHNKISIDQLNTYNSKLDKLITSIPVKHQNRKILITKIAVGSVLFVIFAILMTLYVVPFFDRLSEHAYTEELPGSTGFLIWITPLVLAILVICYKKKIIFK